MKILETGCKMMDKHREKAQDGIVKRDEKIKIEIQIQTIKIKSISN